MKLLSPLDRTAFSELVDLCRIEAEVDAGPYKTNGSFIEETRNGGSDRYWYYRGYKRTSDGSPGRATKTYVGRVGDEAIAKIVADHNLRKSAYDNRRRLVSRLKRAGLPSPEPLEGAVIRAVAETGILEAGAAIVGSAAFQTYGGLLGIRPDQGQYKTHDVDVAQPRGLLLQPGPAATTDVLDALKGADSTFEPYFLADEPRLVLGFRNARGFRLEFLTPLTAERRGARRLSEVAGMPGVGAQQLKFLEFSLTGTVESVMLHEAGLLVPVPDPARYAVHKLIVVASRKATSGSNVSKEIKDVLQAQTLIDGFTNARDMLRLGSTWLEAWNRGPKWRKALRQGTLRLDVKHLSALADSVNEAAVMVGEVSPFEAGDDPRKALLG